MKKKELFRFVQGATVWTFTSADKAETYNGETYMPVAMSRNEIESKSEMTRNSVELTFSLDNEFARRWLITFYDEVVTVTIYEKNDDTFDVAWKGRLLNLKPDTQHIVLVFESIFTSLRRIGLIARYQRSCRHTLYGRGCWLDKATWAVNGTVTDITGGVGITVAEAAGFANSYFSLGMLQLPGDTMRMIVAHAGAVLQIFRPMKGLQDAFNLSGSVPVVLYPGCDLTRNTCINKFNNLLNYGGFDWIPTDNPFQGSILYGGGRFQ